MAPLCVGHHQGQKVAKLFSVEQIDVKHTCCASYTPFQLFDLVPIDLVFSHTSIHQRCRQTAVAATLDWAVLNIQFWDRGQKSCHLYFWASSQNVLSLNIVLGRRFWARLGARMPARPNFPLCSSCFATPTWTDPSHVWVYPRVYWMEGQCFCKILKICIFLDFITMFSLLQ